MAMRGGVIGFMPVILSLLFGVVPVPAVSSVPALEFQLKRLAGEPYSKTSLQGRPTLLVFLAPWCRYCQMELPILAKLYQGNKPDQLQVLTVAFSDSLAHVEEYVTANPDTFIFPTAYDRENEVAQAFGVNATPTFLVMDTDGGNDPCPSWCRDQPESSVPGVSQESKKIIDQRGRLGYPRTELL
ncbi:MAG: TlpA family protein disulfide reductase [Nitrospirales bacterium]|nr:TlpA family protein disulfide reductase [Nitrospirales bacterium]